MKGLLFKVDSILYYSFAKIRLCFGEKTATLKGHSFIEMTASPPSPPLEGRGAAGAQKDTGSRFPLCGIESLPNIIRIFCEMTVFP